MHPDFHHVLVQQHLDLLRRDAARPPRPVRGERAAADPGRVVLRLCRVGDEPALEQLAALNGVPAPAGRVVLAEVDGRLVAALPLAGGRLVADPFVATSDLRRLLELRAAQLREPARRRGFHPARALRSLRA